MLHEALVVATTNKVAIRQTLCQAPIGSHLTIFEFRVNFVRGGPRVRKELHPMHAHSFESSLASGKLPQSEK